MYLQSIFPASSDIDTWYRPIMVQLHHSEFRGAAHAGHSAAPIACVGFIGAGHFGLFLAELQPVPCFYYFIRIRFACWTIPKKRQAFPLEKSSAFPISVYHSSSVGSSNNGGSKQARW